MQAEATLAVRIANPAPQLSIDGFPTDPTDVTATQLPLSFTLSGSTNDPDANVTSVRCALDFGAFETATNLEDNWSRWQKTFSLAAGLHRFTVQALDLGGNQVQQERFLMVHPPVEVPAPGTASITSWTQLEPHSGDADMRRTISARVFDPLWMLTRQWQVGEFQGEDTGSPVIARVRAQSAMLSRCYLGELPAETQTQAPTYDSDQLPLEVMVERRRVRSSAAADIKQLKLRVDAGLHFLRMLEQQPLSKSYRDAFINCYPLLLPDAEHLKPLDTESQRFLMGMAGRVVDARLLEAAFKTSGGSGIALDSRLQVVEGDRAKVEKAAANWLEWYTSLFSESASDARDAWIPERMEYAVSVAAQLTAQPSDGKMLSASELYEGRLDWSDFDLNLEVNLGVVDDRKFTTIVQTTIPAPVSFRGTPAARFWEFEDARIEYGLMPVGPTDLGQLLMIEYTSGYGNDSFVIPMELPVGSLTSVNSLVVTDTFGVRTLIKPIGDGDLPKANWSMFQHSWLSCAGDMQGIIERNLLFLAPTLGRSLESAAVEEVLFIRDEMANIAWAVERTIEGPLGQPLNRGDQLAAQIADASAGRTPGLATSGDTTSTTPANALLRYQLSSEVPANWIPFLPVQLLLTGGVLRLERGAVLQADGSQQLQTSLSSLLNPGPFLLLYDEEVPREGIRVTRHYQMARWINGATFAWLAHRKRVGKGEGSSGLRFDTIEGP